MQSLRAHLESRRGRMVDALRRYIELETPSRDRELGNALAGLLEERLAGYGAAVTRTPLPPFGDVVTARWTEVADPAEKPVLVLLHYDTVWPVGTLAARPVTVDDTHLAGPGAYDMKASLVIVEEALLALSRTGLTPKRPVTVMITSDEEVGSPESRRAIEAEALASNHVLVLEPPLAGGALKSARKGVGRFVVRAHGRAAHAGLEPEKGVNAIVELARHLPAIADLGDKTLETTVNPGLISGGTSRNTVAAFAECELDVRAWTIAEADRVESALRAISPQHPEASIEIEGSFHRPPMELTPASAALLDQATAIAEELGQTLKHGRVGGASDANLTSALGVPTLDGLGALGEGAHAQNEKIEIDSLISRSELLAALLHRL
ncbi:MAG: M20 family metallopeptidase [Thermomicrobiales bacterium]|nr:M20 family metallopeptidase [Thermomicrobiales bacterium]